MKKIFTILLSICLVFQGTAAIAAETIPESGAIHTDGKIRFSAQNDAASPYYSLLQGKQATGYFRYEEKNKSASAVITVDDSEITVHASSILYTLDERESISTGCLEGTATIAGAEIDTLVGVVYCTQDNYLQLSVTLQEQGGVPFFFSIQNAAMPSGIRNRLTECMRGEGWTE